MIHINKGRLHAFRKLSLHDLPVGDCHSMQRAGMVKKEKIVREELCISIAWDWMYRGVTESGIRREVAAAMSCAALNQINGVKSLGIPEAALLHTARSICNSSRSADGKYQPAPEVICRGILQGLRIVIGQHAAAMTCARGNVIDNDSNGRDDKFEIQDKSDADQNPYTSMINAYGSSDYTCRVCSSELSNVYCHCNGCDGLMGKDFNICVGCHDLRKYRSDVTMDENCPVLHSAHHHTGGFRWRVKGCDCVESAESGLCLICNKCPRCACLCHSNFSLHYRFFDEEAEKRLIERVEALGAKPKNYLEKYLDGETTKRCALFPFCLEDTTFCGGFQPGSCWCFKDLLRALPQKEEIMNERKRFSETSSGRELDDAIKKRNADKRQLSRNKNKSKDLVN